MSKELEENKAVLQAILSEHYGRDVSITNTAALLRLHELVERGESSKDLEADLRHIHVSEQQKLERMPKPETEAQIMEYQYRQHVADGLLEAIEEAQRANDRKKYEKDPTKKRQRRRYRGQEFER
jgi:hypothetical protein